MNVNIPIWTYNESPLIGDFIWPPNIKWIIQDILDINYWDFDEQIIELARMQFPNIWNNFTVRDDWSIYKVFIDGGYIRLLKRGNNTLYIDMIQMPWKWIQGVLECITFAVDNWLSLLEWKIQPQKKNSTQRTKILSEFYSNFWFTILAWEKIELKLNHENKHVLVNKLKYYLENWKWFRS